MKKQLIPVVILVVLGVSGAVYWLYWKRDTSPQDNRIFVSGNIEATEVELSFRLSGQIKEFSPDEGDSVEANQVVARLDTDTLHALKNRAEASVAAAKAMLDELETGTREEEIAMAKAALKSAKSKLANARAEYERYLPLFQTKVISASQFDVKETAMEVARAEVGRLEEQLRELKIGPRTERIRQARANLKVAKWELKKIELDLEHSSLYTPVAGVILTKSNEVGEVVLPGAGVATVAELDEVWLKGYVAENMLGRLKLGQRVEVISDTFPDKVYNGRLTFISSRAEFTPKNVQTREERIKQVYRVKVTIPNKHRELKIGMPAEGYIITEEQPQKKVEGPRRRPSANGLGYRGGASIPHPTPAPKYRSAVHMVSER
jgi:HlyD family secretion protein